MASYPTYNPSIWTGGISKREFQTLFGSAHGEPILNRATQGEYAPGLDLEGHLDRGRGRGRATRCNGTYSCPALGDHRRPHVLQRLATRTSARCRLHQALVHVLRHGLLPARLRDLAARPPRAPTT